MENCSLKLILGLPIEVAKNIFYKPPTMKELLDYDYNRMITGVISFYDTTKALMGDKRVLDFVINNDLNDYTILHMFCDSDDGGLKSIVEDSLRLHFQSVEYKDDKFYIDGVLMDKKLYSAISKLYEETYGLQEKISDRKFVNKETKKKMLSMEFNKIKSEQSINGKNGDKNPLYSVLSLLNTRTNQDLSNKTVYQLNDSYVRIVKEKNYDALSYGVYSGNVDKKYLKIKDWLD